MESRKSIIDARIANEAGKKKIGADASKDEQQRSNQIGYALEAPREAYWIQVFYEKDGGTLLAHPLGKPGKGGYQMREGGMDKFLLQHPSDVGGEDPPLKVWQWACER
jgi:hypothetical protein